MKKVSRIFLIIGNVILAFILFFVVSVFFELLTLVLEDNNSIESINECIEKVSKDTSRKYSEITDLVCDLGGGKEFYGKDYDLLSKLTNLESITFLDISNDKAAQLFFEELTKLKKLRSIEIKFSSIESIGKLAEITGLTSLSFSQLSENNEIVDLDLLGYKGSFVNLESLYLDVGLQSLPDLSALENLTSLTINNSAIEELDYEFVNWGNLIELDIARTYIETIDDRIVNDLYNLESLDISRTLITDIQFVLKLPKLKNFSCSSYQEFPTDKEPLREHPNFNTSWLD
ncbi:MAG: hypothetical protein LBM60_08360 [Clostridium sp.]|jgi:Leucine-rich repeat (LRR) protein|nr:hypothetical protein [Clostridium sp.]